MNDFKGNELQVGDKVLFAFATSGYLHEGVIHKFIAQGVSIKHEVADWSKYQVNSPIPTKTKTTNLMGASQRIFKLA